MKNGNTSFVCGRNFYIENEWQVGYIKDDNGNDEINFDLDCTDIYADVICVDKIKVKNEIYSDYNMDRLAAVNSMDGLTTKTFDHKGEFSGKTSFKKKQTPK